MRSRKEFDYELFFSALADRTRLRLLNLMRDGEVCVCFFAETLGTNNPKISRHLAYLKKAGLVASRRDGKWMHYQIAQPEEPKAKEMFESLMEMLEEDGQMALDREKLVSVCCSPQMVQINRVGRARPWESVARLK